MTRIKICGLAREQDIRYVNEAMPDYIGFVFAPSRRQVKQEQAAELRNILAPGILAAGVFVDAPAEEIASICKAGIIDLIQLHGSEDKEYIAQLRRQTMKPIIQAVSVRPETRLETSESDYFLFDQGNGGTGKTFDWGLLPSTEKPFFLAGGLNPGNLGEAIRRMRPFAVDLSSGVETDGVKDREKILQAVRSVRNE